MDAVIKYFPDLSHTQIQQLEALQPLYREWNEKINVISRKDIDHLYIRHVLHSLSIARYINFEPGTQIMDAGTGGGFPGIPLAIRYPMVKFSLVDSVGKKIGVVESIASALQLSNVAAFNERVEKIPFSFDYVVSRAVKSLPLFFSWVRHKIRKKGFNQLPNGIIYLKGWNFESELTGIPMKHKILSLNKYFEEDFFETKKLVHIYR